jgi:hypothetical protein
MRVFWIAIAAISSLAVAGCRSAVITATVSNRGTTPVTLVEVDYPSASFGVQRLAPGEDYHYKFKVIGNGPTTLLWNEPSKSEQKNSGPTLHEGDEGTLTITFRANEKPAWDVHLKGR